MAVRRCLASARFTMRATVLKREYSGDVLGTPETGEWIVIQDPDTGAVTRQWQELPAKDAPDTLLEIDCITTSYTGTAGRNINNLTAFVKDEIKVTEFLNVSWPSKYQVSVFDRITNIRDTRGVLIYDEVERGNLKATVYDITGITPVTDPQGRVVEYYAVLRRTQVQQ